MELIKLKKGDKTITRTRFDYEKNLLKDHLQIMKRIKIFGN